MTGNRKLFSSYKAYNGGNVIFGSNLRGNIIGKGRGIRKKGLCVMKLGNKAKDKICLATIDEDFTLWHRRLGHANMHLIQSLASKELVRNLPKLKFDQHFCDACKIRKQAHASHKAKNIVSMTRCLELLHMDLFGPSVVRSYGGNRYTLVIVDDYSRYTWTRFLKDKTEAFDQFEIFSKKIQNQLGCTIVSIRTDHGREFDNEVQFGEFCNANGITHNFSAPHTPQSNGVVERKNRTLQEMRTKWVFKNKLDENGIVSRNKARLVAQGYNQQEGIEYDETYALVARLESIRILLAYACALDFKLFQMDVKSAFLNGFINEVVYMAQPPRFIDFEKTDLVYKLKKALYGLKQAPKACIKQYFQVQDYALWDVIENGNSFKPAAQTTINDDGSSTTLIPGPITANEKPQKKNNVKARSMLLMALPNEYLLTFNLYKDAKTLFAAIQTRFGGFRRLNKPDLDTMSFDDLYNNFKIVKQVVKGTASLSSSLSSQNLAFMSSTSSTNEVNIVYEFSTANTQASTTSTQVSTANLSDDTVYAFFASQPNGSQLVHEDLEQIHEDDLEEMDLKWWSVSTVISWDTLQRNAEDIGIKITGSFMADKEVPSNMALKDFSDSEVHNDKTCSKTYLKSFKTLKTLLDDLRIEFNKSEFNLATYKRGLASVEEQLVFYKKNEVLFCEQLVVLKRDISYKDSEISVLKRELEKLKQDKESNQFKIVKFDNASKSLDKLIGSQIHDKSRKGLGFVSYNAIPPPSTGLFSPLTIDFSNSGLEEFQQPEFKVYEPKISKSVNEDISNEVMISPDALLVEELVSNDKLEKKTVIPTVAKINFVTPQQQKNQLGNQLTAITIKGKGWPKALNTARPNTAVVNAVKANQVNAVKASACYPQIEDQGYVDSGYSRHMTSNMSYLLDFKEFDGGYVTFGGGAKGGRITGKGTLKTDV
ncbi:retrovirus-related pol polyprotein from transposon TNT 1-94 [Tanacetum coccineum]